MQHTIHTRDELVLESHPEGDTPHILLRREGEPDSVRITLNEARDLADAMKSSPSDRRILTSRD